MRKPGKGGSGLTLAELLIVISITSFILAVVAPNVAGFIQRGGAEAHETDREVIQLAVRTFCFDGQKGLVRDPNRDGDCSDTRWGCKCNGVFEQSLASSGNSGYLYPTALAYDSYHTLYADNIEDPYNKTYPTCLIVGGSGAAGIATDMDISNHAVWMGLLVNEPGAYASADADGLCDGPASECGTTHRLKCSVLQDNRGLYIEEMPASSMATDAFNGAAMPGSKNCWIVGMHGLVYGVYKGDDGNWYAGFKGVYP